MALSRPDIQGRINRFCAMGTCSMSAAAEGHLGHDTIYSLAPSCAVSHWHAADAAGRCCPFPSPLSASSSCTRSRKPLSAHAARAVSGAPCATQTCDQRHPPRLGLAGTLVRLASGISHGATGDLDPLASAGLPALLALEIQAWTSADPCGPASPHPAYGAGEPVMGRGAYRQRTLAQAGLT